MLRTESKNLLSINVDTDDVNPHVAIQDALRDPRTRPTAVLCFSAAIAVSLYRAARALDLAIPHNLSVISVGDTECVELLSPPLTTIDIAPEQSGQLAADLIMKAIRNEAGEHPATYRIEPRLIERGSVRTV